jgi:hypothetical protein
VPFICKQRAQHKTRTSGIDGRGRLPFGIVIAAGEDRGRNAVFFGFARSTRTGIAAKRLPSSPVAGLVWMRAQLRFGDKAAVDVPAGMGDF